MAEGRTPADEGDVQRIGRPRGLPLRIEHPGPAVDLDPLTGRHVDPASALAAPLVPPVAAIQLPSGDQASPPIAGEGSRG